MSVIRQLLDTGGANPNFANFLYNTQTGQLGLLDFGATRRYTSTVAEAYRGLLGDALRDDRAAMSESAAAIGYFKEHIHARLRAKVDVRAILEPHLTSEVTSATV